MFFEENVIVVDTPLSQEDQLQLLSFLQRVSIACYAERCISYDRFRPSVCPSVRPFVRLTRVHFAPQSPQVTVLLSV